MTGENTIAGLASAMLLLDNKTRELAHDLNYVEAVNTLDNAFMYLRDQLKAVVSTRHLYA